MFESKKSFFLKDIAFSTEKYRKTKSTETAAGKFYFSSFFIKSSNACFKLRKKRV